MRTCSFRTALALASMTAAAARLGDRPGRTLPAGAEQEPRALLAAAADSLPTG